jgi:phosphoribosylanthranilate isomerase
VAHSPRVKVCGITTLEDARLAASLGAWALGLILWPGSPRRCRLDVAAEIAAELRRRVAICGVFVNATLDHVARVAEDVPLSHLQLHGDEGPSYCAEAARRTGCKVVKAARIHDAGDLRALEPFHVDFHLLDSGARGLRGGTGETFDWELARRRRSRVPVILSGGLTPDNVAEGIAAVRPWAVDTASGTEAEPGRKDPERLAAFFDAVRAAGERAAA